LPVMSHFTKSVVRVQPAGPLHGNDTQTAALHSSEFAASAHKKPVVLHLSPALG
jgi:hypothetical protein